MDVPHKEVERIAVLWDRFGGACGGDVRQKSLPLLTPNDSTPFSFMMVVVNNRLIPIHIVILVIFYVAVLRLLRSNLVWVVLFVVLLCFLIIR